MRSTLKILGVGIIAIIGIHLAGCEQNAAFSGEHKTGSIIQGDTSQSVFEKIIYPDVKYNLGDTSYTQLFRAMVQENGSDENREQFDQIIECRRRFEKNESTTAFTSSLRTLAIIWDKNKASGDVSDLIRSEAIYQVSRSFFYERNEVMNPTCTLIETGINISKKYINSQDSLIQQVALFQLARHFDVLQGLTKQYSSYIAPLPEEQLTYASKNAVEIKKELLGLKGGPVIRSLSNLFLDYEEICQSEYKDDCRYLNQDVTHESYGHLRYLSKKEHDEYGEFINVILRSTSEIALKNGDYETSRNAIEQGIAQLAGISSYKLGDEVPRFTFKEGVEHHSNWLVSELQKYIANTGKDRFEWISDSIVQRIRSNNISQFLKANRSNNASFAEISDLTFQKNIDEFESGISFSTEEETYNFMINIFKKYGLQEITYRAKTKLIRSDTVYSAQYSKTIESENKMRNAELRLDENISTENLIACANRFEQYRKNLKKFNELSINELFSVDFSELKDVREKLKKNEIWVVICNPNIRSEFFLVFSITNEDVKARVLMNQEIIDSGNLSLRAAMKGLEEIVINNKRWETVQHNRTKLVAEHCFEGIINPESKHIILSDLGHSRSRIWDLFIQSYAEEINMDLRSIRHDNQFIFNDAPDDQIAPATWYAMAPRFSKSKYVLNEDTRLSLMNKLRSAGKNKLNPWFNNHSQTGYSSISYNTQEVLEVNKTVDGFVYIGQEANEDKLKQIESKNAVIHIASHAFLEENDIYRSGIVMSNNGKTHPQEENDGILFAYEIRTMDLNAELVVLSACETGISPSRRSGFDWSLGRAFLEAGCKSTITSQWNVNDKATHDIIIEFYKGLRNGMGKAEALYSAKQAYRKTHPHVNPHYWTPLVLTGDNRPVKFVSKQ